MQIQVSPKSPRSRIHLMWKHYRQIVQALVPTSPEAGRARRGLHNYIMREV